MPVRVWPGRVYGLRPLSLGLSSTAVRVTKSVMARVAVRVTKSVMARVAVRVTKCVTTHGHPTAGKKSDP